MGELIRSYSTEGYNVDLELEEGGRRYVITFRDYDTGNVKKYWAHSMSQAEKIFDSLCD